MPTYTYKCLACDLDFHHVREIKRRDAPIHCPQCGSVWNTKRQLDTPNFHTRGLNFGDRVKVS